MEIVRLIRGKAVELKQVGCEPAATDHEMEKIHATSCQPRERLRKAAASLICLIAVSAFTGCTTTPDSAERSTAKLMREEWETAICDMVETGGIYDSSAIDDINYTATLHNAMIGKAKGEPILPILGYASGNNHYTETDREWLENNLLLIKNAASWYADMAWKTYDGRYLTITNALAENYIALRNDCLGVWGGWENVPTDLRYAPPICIDGR